MRHVLFPVLGIVAFVPALLTAAGIPAFSFVTKLSAPISYAGPVVGVWMVLGMIYLAYLWSRHRQRVIDTGRVHLDADVEDIAHSDLHRAVRVAAPGTLDGRTDPPSISTSLSSTSA